MNFARLRLAARFACSPRLRLCRAVRGLACARGFFDAFNRGDFEACIDLCTPDLTYYQPGSPPLDVAGYRGVRANWSECRSDGMMVENMIMFYDEVHGRLESLGLMTAQDIEVQKQLLRALPADQLPAAWGVFRVACEV